MLVPHSQSTVPPAETSLWRYMDFTKFVSLLHEKALYFPRLDKLPDKYEGTFPKKALDDARADPVTRSFMEMLHKTSKTMYYASCWHVNEHESAAMWKLYLSSGEGVAVRTTYQRLIASQQGWPYKLYAGMVSYIDYTKDLFSSGGYPINSFFPVVTKRKSFAHENEFRLLFWDSGIGNDASKLGLPRDGLLVPVDLKVLLERVYVAPTTDEWFRKVVVNVIEGQGLRFEVIRSEIDSENLY